MVKLELCHREIANGFNLTYSNLRKSSNKEGMRQFENCVIETAKSFVKSDNTFDFGSFVTASLSNKSTAKEKV